ncbi:hypothetical protein PGH12_04795 [Chryseobacterium wangxinyae]|uniref:hypothetical protein n=1 Tax=Chryseobacterium sp. CY350 TaxID=2997336 RepID=UPI0022717E9F|nr:hypothetical protein [Chryseobacterium sp. CY350]MCY0976464.1 hypothetical protein [Chryseobacterium sp. CY350]WBZ96468.1 hypothetical protein PGH12_04795 [Chryseobacterium sp. CY350]
MYAKYIVLFCLLGLSALLPAQAVDHNRINIRIYPAQVLSISSGSDLNKNSNTQKNIEASERRELIVSNLYGYQIKTLSERSDDQAEKRLSTKDCPPNSRLLYQRTSSSADQRIGTTNYSEVFDKKCTSSNNERLLVYLIITQ